MSKLHKIVDHTVYYRSGPIIESSMVHPIIGYCCG